MCLCGGRGEGRGKRLKHAAQMEVEERYSGKSGQFESVADSDGGKGPAKSVEGWICFVSGINEEASEEGKFA